MKGDGIMDVDGVDKLEAHDKRDKDGASKEKASGKGTKGDGTLRDYGIGNAKGKGKGKVKGDGNMSHLDYRVSSKRKDRPKQLKPHPNRVGLVQKKLRDVVARQEMAAATASAAGPAPSSVTFPEAAASASPPKKKSRPGRSYFKIGNSSEWKLYGDLTPMEVPMGHDVVPSSNNS